MKPGSPQAAMSAEKSLMREADAYWSSAVHWCQSCEAVELGEWVAPWMCEQCIADRAEADQS